MIGVLFFGLTIVLSAVLSDRLGSRAVLMGAALLSIAFGLGFAPLFGHGSHAQALIFLCVGLSVMGMTYGPLGTALAGLFPTAIRYTGASLVFNMAGAATVTLGAPALLGARRGR